MPLLPPLLRVPDTQAIAAVHHEKGGGSRALCLLPCVPAVWNPECPRAPVAEQAPAAAEPEEKKEKVLTINDLKKVNKPDEVVLKEKVAEEDEKIAALQARLTAIKESLDSRDNGRGETNSELAAAKAKYNEARAESRRLQQVRSSNLNWAGPTLGVLTPLVCYSLLTAEGRKGSGSECSMMWMLRHVALGVYLYPVRCRKCATVLRRAQTQCTDPQLSYRKRHAWFVGGGVMR